MDPEDFPRAHCHQEEVDARVQKHEQKYCTPLNDQDYVEILASVHADFEACDCDCCSAA